MKRKILTAIILTVVLALSLFTAACGDGESVPSGGNVTFKVTVGYDSEQGTVSVTDKDGNNKTEFGAGAKVVVTVTANEGYVLDAFTVNGVDAQLTNGAYDFVIVANTAVEVAFKKADNGGNEKTPEELFAEAFESVKTTFMAVGSYTYQEEGEDPYVYNVTTVFGDGAVNITETDETGDISNDDVYVDIDGKLAMPYHTIDNELAYLYPENDEEFADYDNPFKALTTEDFVATQTENIFALTDADKAKKAATAITGWVENIASFTVTIRDGKVMRINIVTDRIKQGADETAIYYKSDYTFTLSEWGTAAVDAEALAPYNTTAAHTALKNALEKASKAKNYTLHIYEQEAGYEDLDYYVYVTETAIYDSCVGWEAGYVEMNLDPDDEDGMLVYPFRIGDEEDGPEKDGKVVIRDAVDYPTVKSMRADFTGFAPEIFENDGEVYTLHSDCINYTDDVLVHFADGADNIILYRDYALSVQITLKDGKLYQVEMYYYVYGALVKRTITYSEWDSTTMPISFDEWVKESVLDDYVGTYTDGPDDKATLVLKITNEQITINNYPVEIESYDYQIALFTVSYQGQTCYIRSMSKKQMVVLIGDKLYNVTNIEIEPVNIPTEFNGAWKDADGNSVTIAYDKVMFGADMLKVLSYDEDEGLIAVRGKVTYGMTVSEDSSTLSVDAVNADLMHTQYALTKDASVTILPEAFVGTYAAFRDMVDFKVVITLTGVTVKMDNDRSVATDVEVTTDPVKGTVLSFKLGDDDCVIAQQSFGSGINFVCGSIDVNLPQTEDDDPADPPVVTVDIPEAFYGEYQYINVAEHEYYFLSIDEDGIIASIDMSSVEYTAEILEFDEEYDFMLTVSINGKTFYLCGSVDNMTDDGKYNIIKLMNDKTGDDSIEVELLRDGYEPENPDEPTPTFDIPTNFIGVYEGTRNGAEYVLTITETEMTLKVGDAESVKVTIKNYEITSGKNSEGNTTYSTVFTVKISGMGFTSVRCYGDVTAMGDTLVSTVYLWGDGIVTLNRITETDDNA